MLFCSFDALPYEKFLHMFVEAVGQTIDILNFVKFIISMVKHG